MDDHIEGHLIHWVGLRKKKQHAGLLIKWESRDVYRAADFNDLDAALAKTETHFDEVDCNESVMANTSIARIKIVHAHAISFCF